MTEEQNKLFRETWDALGVVAKNNYTLDFYDFIRAILAVAIDFSRQLERITGDSSVEFADNFWQELMFVTEGSCSDAQTG